MWRNVKIFIDTIVEYDKYDKTILICNKTIHYYVFINIYTITTINNINVIERESIITLSGESIITWNTICIYFNLLIKWFSNAIF